VPWTEQKLSAVIGLRESRASEALSVEMAHFVARGRVPYQQLVALEDAHGGKLLLVLGVREIWWLHIRHK